MRSSIYIIILAGFFLLGCKPGTQQELPHSTLFTALHEKETGITFSNTLHYDKAFNLFKYIYFYNGSGIAAGDFNNDGHSDLLFGSNQGKNTLYLNQGNLKFKDVTGTSGMPDDGGWTTGLSVVDINQDGKLDVYVCRVGDFETLKSKNLLLINTGNDAQGNPTFQDSAAAYGLDFSGFSTQAVFFDQDLDGDLDMFLLNHSVHQNGTFAPRATFNKTMHPLSGDRFYRNENNRFKDVTKDVGIYSTAIGYGLGVVASDINTDGYPDLYIGNDFHENDYLYLNDQKGGFTEVGTDRMMHTSQFSMGVDAGDVTNDGLPDIISMDMLPSDPEILKRSLGEDAYDIFQFKIGAGYSYQYTRNNLQHQLPGGHFSETGLYSGIAATDWSWSALWLDFDNDGWKDLFVSNGIPKRMNDIDYVNFVTDGEMQQKITSNSVEGKDMALINKFPEIKLPNRFYKNTGSLHFEDLTAEVRGDAPSFSNGAAYADLDNDGDLDLVVNNIDEPATIYKNETTNKTKIQVRFDGMPGNVQGIGARVLVQSGGQKQVFENYPVHGFLSSMQNDVFVNATGKIDSMWAIWPDGRCQSIPDSAKGIVQLSYQHSLPKFNFATYRNDTHRMPLSFVSVPGMIDWLHRENKFLEFNRESLLPQLLSTEGPAATLDTSDKQKPLLYLGGARNQPKALFAFNGKAFVQVPQPALQNDSTYEDVAAVWTDVNNDGLKDLVVASGGNEFYGTDWHNAPRLYLKQKNGLLVKDTVAFSAIHLTASGVVAADFDQDGNQDIIFTARTTPFAYGKPCTSYFLQGNGRGGFKDITSANAPALAKGSMITSCRVADADKNGYPDIVYSTQWGGIYWLMNTSGKLNQVAVTNLEGWWNTATPFDADGDGDLDIFAGNLGLNSRLQASPGEPVEMYYGDFDDNGTSEQLLTYQLAGKRLPFANKAELEKQMPYLKKKFLYAADFAKASLTDLVPQTKLDAALHYKATEFRSGWFRNNGSGNYSFEPFGWEAQLTALYAFAPLTSNTVLAAGNFYGNNIQMGRYDAGYGLLLQAMNGKYQTALEVEQLMLNVQVKHLLPFSIGANRYVVAVSNSDQARVFSY